MLAGPGGAEAHVHHAEEPRQVLHRGQRAGGEGHGDPPTYMLS